MSLTEKFYKMTFVLVADETRSGKRYKCEMCGRHIPSYISHYRQVFAGKEKLEDKKPAIICSYCGGIIRKDRMDKKRKRENIDSERA